MGQGQGHLLAPFVHFTKDLLSAYAPGIGDTINKTDMTPVLRRLAGRKKQVNKHASKVITDYNKY